MPPTPVEITSSLMIYDAAANTWSKGVWNLFRRDGAYKYAAIDFSSSGNNIIISGISGKKIYISTLILTVGGETNITLYDGATAISGPMDFGGTAEPRGIVVPFGIFPIELGAGNNFIIESSNAVQVSGTAIYTQE